MKLTKTRLKQIINMGITIINFGILGMWTGALLWHNHRLSAKISKTLDQEYTLMKGYEEKLP